MALGGDFEKKLLIFFNFPMCTAKCLDFFSFNNLVFCWKVNKPAILIEARKQFRIMCCGSAQPDNISNSSSYCCCYEPLPKVFQLL